MPDLVTFEQRGAVEAPLHQGLAHRAAQAGIHRKVGAPS